MRHRIWVWVCCISFVWCVLLWVLCICVGFVTMCLSSRVPAFWGVTREEVFSICVSVLPSCDSPHCASVFGCGLSCESSLILTRLRQELFFEW